MSNRLTDEQLEELERQVREKDEPYYFPDMVLALIEEVKSWRQLEKK